MSKHSIEIRRTEYRFMDRWGIRIDWPYGPSEFAQTKWGAYRKARRLLARPPKELYIVDDAEDTWT